MVQQARQALGNVWAVVALVALALAALVLLSIAGRDSSAVVGFIGAAVVPTVTVMLVGNRVSDQVAEVHRQVNGRFSEAIAKIPDPAQRPTPEG